MSRLAARSTRLSIPRRRAFPSDPSGSPTVQATCSDVTTIDVYTVAPLDTLLAETVLRPAGAAAIHGVRWFPSRPPIVGLEYEMDLRGVAREIVVPMEPLGS